MKVSDYLKENTAKYHDEIEEKLASKKLFDGSFTDQDYYKMLQVNHQFLKAYENQLKSFLTAEDLSKLSLTNFDKTDLIEKDLVELNLEKLSLTSETKIQNRAEALGALYVIEGSMLGGNVIAKTLKKYDDLALKSFNYFGHYGENLGTSWKAFIQYINVEFTTEDEQKSVLDGALKAYQDLISFA